MTSNKPTVSYILFAAVIYDVFKDTQSSGHCTIGKIEGFRERTKNIDIFLFFRPSLNGVLFPMFCLLVEGECQILVF